MPSKITRIINRPPSVGAALDSFGNIFDMGEDIGYNAFFALHEIPPDIIANKGFAEGVMFKINPQTGQPMLTQGGDYYLTDAGLKIVQQEGGLRDNIANAFTQSPEAYTAKDVDPGRQAWEKKVYAPQPDPWNDPDQRALEVVTRQYQQTNAAIPRRTNPDLGKEISRKEFYSRQKNEQGIRPSAHTSQMGVPSQPVPGTSSELSLEGSSGNQSGVSSMIPRKYPTLQEVAQGVARDLAQRTPVVTEPAELVGMVAPYPSPQEFSQGVVRELVQRGNPVTAPDVQVQQAVQEQAGKAAAGSNAQDVKQEAAAIQKETSTGRAGDIPWWQNPYYYVAGAGGALGGAILGNALSGGSPSYEEQMMMSQYGQMPSSFDDRYGY